ncbi:TauD/TfdA family dioxygenase [Candidatus Binatia bacterium]|nr:TauD/TfdA family dioxygenase [Candidatus Binatia bacterium]
MLEILPVTPTIGAEIVGIDLADGCSDADFAAIEDAWLRHKVLFFPDQRRMTTEQHVALCRRFGELELHPFAPSKPGHPEVMTVIANPYRRGNENTWHSDVTWREEPSRGSMLRAIQIPPVGGDTLFADMEAAYDGLDAALQERLAGLRAVHDLTKVAATIAGADAAKALAEKYPPVEHPVIRTHPTTGRRSIYVNAAFTTHVAGLDADDSTELLQLLYRQAAIPEYQCRLRWRPGTIALWDNRCTQHYAASDYFPAERVMERVTIVGDRPH